MSFVYSIFLANSLVITRSITLSSPIYCVLELDRNRLPFHNRSSLLSTYNHTDAATLQAFLINNTNISIISYRYKFLRRQRLPPRPWQRSARGSPSPPTPQTPSVCWRPPRKSRPSGSAGPSCPRNN